MSGSYRQKLFFYARAPLSAFPTTFHRYLGASRRYLPNVENVKAAISSSDRGVLHTQSIVNDEARDNDAAP